ncbi:DUF2807 domain-containing protein [Massilia sp. erpn]|nr:DUF2807 domain-containing protein [Massilia sp. erpn]
MCILSEVAAKAGGQSSILQDRRAAAPARRSSPVPVAGILFPPARSLSQGGGPRHGAEILSAHTDHKPKEETMLELKTIPAAARGIVLVAGLLAAAAPLSQAVAGPASWFRGERVQGSGKIVKQSREPGHFSGIGLGMSGNVEIRVGNSESVTIETDENILPLIETVVENGTLKIRPVKKDTSFDTRNLRIVVQARALEKVSVGGSGNVEVNGMRGERLQFDVGGSGNINARGLEGASVAVSLGGSGSLKASGMAENVNVSIGGSGKVALGQLQARNVTVSIGGSGEAIVWAKESLNTSVAGSGDVSYYGDPRVNKNVTGSGSVRRAGGVPQ